MRELPTIFSEEQSISGLDAADVVSTNVIQLPALQNAFGTAITPDSGQSGRLYLTVQVIEVLVGAGAAVVAKYTSKAGDASIGSSGTTHVTFTFPAESAVGTKFVTALPFGTINTYQGIVYTVSGAELDSSKFTAFLSIDQETPTT